MGLLNVIVAGFVCLVCMFLAVRQIHVNRRNADLVSFSTRSLPFCLLALAVLSAACVLSGENAMCLLSLELIVGIFPLLLLASSFLPKNVVSVAVPLIVGVAMNLVHLCAFFWWEYQPSTTFYCALCVVAAFAHMAYFLVSLWLYIRRVRNVVQKTTAWMILAMSVDVVYIFAIVSLAVMLYCSSTFSCCACMTTAVFVVAMFMIVVVALSYRIATDSLFFVMRRHETIILESLNDLPCDLAGERTAPEDMYKEIFDRVVDHFETDLPYLRGNLVIEDLVKVVYANKLYISRAIGRCAGRNFCQFVNYYRVKHSVEVFRQNPDLKVTELAGQCGFNSVVSFTMAFKLYMNENPSDWIRKERSRMIKFGQ
jgi:AraC-like DNA-binding protein